MMLSTLARAKAAVGANAGVEASTEARMRAMLEGITPVFESFTNRKFFVEEFVQDMDVSSGQTQFNLRAFPVRSVESVSFDATAFHTTSTELVDGVDYVADRDGVRLAVPPLLEGSARRALRVAYTGGLVYGLDQGRLTLSGVTGTPAGAFTTPYGGSGTVVSYASMLLDYTAGGGKISKGQVLTGSGWSATVASITRECVLNDYPGLEEAALMQFGFRWQRKDMLGRSSSPLANGGVMFDIDYKLHPAVQEYLLHLKRTATDA